MHKTKLTISVLIGVILILSGCGLFASPSRTTKNFYLALEAGALDEAMKLVSNKTKNGISPDKLRAGLGEVTRAIKQRGGIDSIEITKEEITGEIADVAGTMKYKNGTTEDLTQKLVKENSDWKIELH